MYFAFRVLTLINIYRVFCKVKFRVSISKAISIHNPYHREKYNYGFRTVDFKKEISAKCLTFLEIFCVIFYKPLDPSPIISRQFEHVTPSVCVTARRIACLSCVLHIAATGPL